MQRSAAREIPGHEILFQGQVNRQSSLAPLQSEYVIVPVGVIAEDNTGGSSL
jgi:hypothetical protein